MKPETPEGKLDRLLRRHRASVFHPCEATADAHARAIRRLKATATAQRVALARHEAENYRIGQALERQGY